MATYQGPNASVRQEFVTSPGAVAVENLPSVAVASAYNVFAKQSLGTDYGITDTELAWGSSNVIYEESISGKKAFDMYPPKGFANTKFGYIDLLLGNSDMDGTGITLGVDSTFVLPNTEKVAGACQAIIPFYKLTTTAGVSVLATDLTTVIITGGAVVTAKVKPGMKVFADGDLLGVVASIGSDETKVKLAAASLEGAFSGRDEIVIGCGAYSTLNVPDILWDPTANFVTAKVAPGDILKFSSLAVSGSTTTPIEVSVTSVIDKNTLRFNTVAPEAGQIDYDISKYMTSTTAPGSTIQLYSYSVNRLLGFSKNLGYKLMNTSNGIAINTIDTTKTVIKFFSAQVTTMPSKGDILMVTVANVADATNERSKTDIVLFKVDTVSVTTITLTNDGYQITCLEPILQSESGNPVAANANFINLWRPLIETEIVADFRSVRSEEHMVVKRITSTQDIFTAWVRAEETTIDPRNELAFMMSVIFGLSGGKVCYGVNVDATAANQAAEYSDALEELKLKDVYSHSFGTTDSGVNALAGPYCDDQAAPYEAHERTAIICYDLDDLFLMGECTGNIATTGIISSLGGGFNPMVAGITVNDVVNIYDVAGDFVAQATVVSTPIVSTEVVTDWTGSAGLTGQTFKFESGRKDDQAVRAGSIKYGNRRVAMLFPGWFYADFNGERMLLPPYFIAAAIAGMDSGVIVSQSFTNMPFSIPGLANIQLDTNTFYRKAQLDEIGGGGVDIMIQDANITQSIKSRHDLTTNMDAVQYRERSITKQADVVAKTLRSAVNPYVGRYNVNDPNLMHFLGQVCSVVATKLVKDGIVARVVVTKIARDEVIDDKINFFVECTVFIAGNYYDITLLVKSR